MAIKVIKLNYFITNLKLNMIITKFNITNFHEKNKEHNQNLDLHIYLTVENFPKSYFRKLPSTPNKRCF